MVYIDRPIHQTLINDVNDYIKEYGAEHGHKIIFGAMGSGNIMYAKEATDITKDVLEGLNNRYNGK
ncbi:OmpH family outer membrane protein [Flagellimonas sp.]|uniref:OmpH family outer membrane protein n=1 Tax=Flagellimonas sp. TaxID=2058762 RepID=UPI003AB669DB